nr:pyrroloquinoline quinone precursor peptide PqqA [uncultured Paraglaciecola sp.]
MRLGFEVTLYISNR